jgi:hypothetical protein
MSSGRARNRLMDAMVLMKEQSRMKEFRMTKV